MLSLPAFIAIGVLTLVVGVFYFHISRSSKHFRDHSFIGGVLIIIGIASFLLLAGPNYSNPDLSASASDVLCKRSDQLELELEKKRRELQVCGTRCDEQLEAFINLNAEVYRCSYGFNLGGIQTGESTFTYRLEY
jgi:hypothetical protein